MAIHFLPWIMAVIVLLTVISIVLYSWKNGISPMPTSGVVRRAVIREVNRIPGYGDLIEAGSGWGTLSLDVVRHCPGKRLLGIENSLVPLWSSRLLAFLSIRLRRMLGQRQSLEGRLRFLRGDIYSSSYEHADGVICYLFPGAMERLMDKFSKELPPGARVISVCFALPRKKPLRTITCRDVQRTKVYVYVF